MGGAEAVGAGVAAADDDDALAFGAYLGGRVAGGVEAAGVHGHTLVAVVLLGEILHGEVGAVQVAAGDFEVAGGGGAAAEGDGVEVVDEVVGGDVLADKGAGDELDSLCGHDVDALLDELVAELEVGDAEAEEAADEMVAFVDGDEVAGAVELLGAGEAGGAGADDGDRLAGALRGRLGLDPALFVAAVGDGLLDELNGDGVVVDGESAGDLAGGGADAAGELGEVVGGEQTVERLLPTTAVDEVVPVGDEIAERAALVAEGDAAVHAAGRPALGRARAATPGRARGSRRRALRPAAWPAVGARNP